MVTYQQTISKNWKYPNLFQGLIGGWCPSLGIQGGNLYDISGNGLTISLVGYTLSNAWRQYQGLYSIFNAGGVAYGNAPNTIPIFSQICISCWVNFNNTSGVQMVHSKDWGGNGGQYGTTREFQLYLSGSLNFTAFPGGTNVASSVTIVTNTWYHVIAYIDRINSKIGIIVNGVLNTASYTTTGLATGTPNFIIGKFLGQGDYLNGSVDDILYYNRVLNQSENNLLYSNGYGRGIAYTQKPLNKFSQNYANINLGNRMAFIVHDRIKETTTTTGSGSLTLLGAVTQFTSFSGAIGQNSTFYTLVSGDNVNWETGVGSYSYSGLLTRDTVIESSIGGAKIALAGTTVVFCGLPAQRAVYLNSFGIVANTMLGSGTYNNQTFLRSDGIYQQPLADSITQMSRLY